MLRLAAHGERWSIGAECGSQVERHLAHFLGEFWVLPWGVIVYSMRPPNRRRSASRNRDWEGCEKFHFKIVRKRRGLCSENQTIFHTKYTTQETGKFSRITDIRSQAMIEPVIWFLLYLGVYCKKLLAVLCMLKAGQFFFLVTQLYHTHVYTHNT